jgi:ASC-1-like (ASCH) protein
MSKYECTPLKKIRAGDKIIYNGKESLVEIITHDYLFNQTKIKFSEEVFNEIWSIHTKVMKVIE